MKSSSKPCCVAAFFTKGFGRLSIHKAAAHCGSTRRCENFVYIGFKYIAECHYPVGIEATGYQGAVTQNTEMILESIAKDRVAHIVNILVGPQKALAEFKVEFIVYAVALAALSPFALQAGFEHI